MRSALPCPQIETILHKIASIVATISCDCKTATLDLKILLKVPSRIIFRSGGVTLNQLGLENSFEAGLLVIKLLGPSAGIFLTGIFRGGADDTSHRGLGQMPEAGEAVNAMLYSGVRIFTGNYLGFL
jgi:hypothetical protein